MNGELYIEQIREALSDPKKLLAIGAAADLELRAQGVSSTATTSTKPTTKPWEWLAAVGIGDDDDCFDSVLMALELTDPCHLTDEDSGEVTPFPNDATEKTRLVLAQWHADQFETIKEVKLRADSFLERLAEMGLEVVERGQS